MNAARKKSVIAKIGPSIRATGLQHVFRSKYGGIGHILMFHRIVQESRTKRIHNHLSLEITPEHFVQIIEFFVKRNYAFLSLEQIYDVYKNDSFPANKFVAITFDDGYKDNIEIAYPILKKYNIPFTVYITTAIPNGNAILWWYLLEDLVLNNEEIQFEWQGNMHSYSCRNVMEKEEVFEKIQGYIHEAFTIDTYQDLFKEIFKAYHSDFYQYASKLGMTWEEIIKLNNDPLVTIGAHTVNHFPLAKLPLVSLNDEIRNSKMELEERLQEPINHFAYPFGKQRHASLREYGIVQDLNFKTATTTKTGNLFSEHSSRQQSLPRININRVTNHHVLDLQTSGLLPFIVNKGKKIV